MEEQLARLNKSDEIAGTKTNLRYVLRLFRDYIATLDEAIDCTHTKTHSSY